MKRLGLGAAECGSKMRRFVERFPQKLCLNDVFGEISRYFGVFYPTRKSVWSVLISAAGLKRGKYSGNVMTVITGEDLFADVKEA